MFRVIIFMARVSLGAVLLDQANVQFMRPCARFFFFLFFFSLSLVRGIGIQSGEAAAARGTVGHPAGRHYRAPPGLNKHFGINQRRISVFI